MTFPLNLRSRVARPLIMWSRPAPQRQEFAFTLVELLVVIGIIGIFAALGLPVIQHMMRQGQQTQCLASLKSMGQAFQLYASDNNSMLPPPNINSTNQNLYWRRSILPYVGISASDPQGPYRGAFICPAVAEVVAQNKGNPRVISFAMNYSLAAKNSSGLTPIRLAAVARPASVMLATDGWIGQGDTVPQPIMNTNYISGTVLQYHQNSIDILYVSGNAARLPDATALLRAPLAPGGTQDIWDP